MPRMARFVVVVCCVAGGLCPADSLRAEPRKKAVRQTAALADVPQDHAPSADVSAEIIQKRLKQVEESPKFDPVVKKNLVDTYTEALEHVHVAGEHAAKVADLRKATTEAPREMQRVRAKLDAPRRDPVPEITPDMGLSEMQQALAEAEDMYDTLQKRLEELQSEPQRRAERRQAIPELQQNVQRVLEELEEQGPGGTTSAPADPLTVADTVRRSAHRRALEHELEVYEEELRHYETTSDLVEARRDHALLLAEQAEKQMKAWRTAVNERRKVEAERESREALEVAKNASPALKRLAEANAALAAKRQDLVARIELVTQEEEVLQNQVDGLEALSRRIRERVRRVGLTESIGALLRKQQESIPRVAEHQKYIEERKAEMVRLNLELVDLEDQRGELSDLDERVDRIVAEMGPGRKGRKNPSAAEIRKVLEDTREYLDSQIKDTNTLEDLLHKLNVTEAELISEAQDFSQYTNEYILWIKSADVPAARDVREAWSAAGWLLASANWSLVVGRFQDDLREHPTRYLGLFALIVTLAFSQRVWRRMLRISGRNASNHHTTSVWTTAQAVLATCMLSLLAPAVLWLAGWRLAHLAGRSEFLHAVAYSWQGAAFFLATINFTRHLCRSHGLGEAHFDWPAGCLGLIRRNMWWQAAVGLPLIMVVLMPESQADESIKNSLGRLAFFGLQLLLVGSSHAVWHSPQGFSQHLTQLHATGKADRWWLRLCRLAHVSAFAVPVALALLACVGYYYTAVQLAQRVLATSWLVGGLFVLHATLLRWLLLAYRDLARKRAREPRELAGASKIASERPAAVPGAEPTVRLADINAQTHKLLGILMCGIFLFASSVIWVEVLPALKLLETVQLWPHPFTIFDPAAKRDPGVYYLTLAQLLSALLLGLATAAAARNVPGLIEITVLRHLKLDSGARYAVSAVTQYAITACGLALAFSCVGVGWNNVQWLIAAMTVGLGFGLQEIFANFASGLLLLVERPIRVGDLVSIGDVTGKVTRIRIRATTITDGDMREAIVPNREFISGKVLNWTLTDATSRMTFAVKVPMGCNPDRVKQVLLGVAAAHPLVLKDPAPFALLDDFVLDKQAFTLRVYMASCDVSSQLRHELNSGIRAAFLREGIDKTTVEDQPEFAKVPPPRAA